MRLRRLCLAIFAFRLFLREPIQFFQSRNVRFNHLIHRVATRFLWLLCNYDHALPQKRYSARSNEANDAETGIVQQLRESLARPELDVSAVPEGIEMCVPLVGERKNKILRVAVIRRADDNVTAGPEQLLRETRQATRSSEMLNYLGSNSHIEALIANRSWIVVHSELMKYQPGRRTLCEPNAVRARLATDHFVSAPGKLARERAVPAPNIDDSSRAQLRAKRDDLRPQICLRVRRLHGAVVILQMVHWGRRPAHLVSQKLHGTRNRLSFPG